ncbi:MAG: hypothetical protein KGH98_00850 [Candidatus Micrarchaeota archaeon]|nr:hypothetical protein [Candidatus Micrarchaeota archaeon]
MLSKKTFLLLSLAIIATLSASAGAAQQSQAQQQSCSQLPQSVQQQISQNEPWYLPINSQIAQTWCGDLPLAFTAVMLAFLVAAAIFMIGTALKSDRIRNFGIGEIYEATASGIIVLLFLYLSAVLFGILPAVFVGPVSPYPYILHQLQSTINGTETMYTSLTNVYITDQFYNNLEVKSLYVNGQVLPIVGEEGGATSVGRLKLLLQVLFIDPAVTLAGLMTDGILALHAQYYLIVFFAISAIPVFLVPGIVLRAFFPTRALGGMMVAIAIAFYLVTPSLFAIAYYFTLPSMQSNLAAYSASLNKYGAGTGAEVNALSPTSPLVTTLASAQHSLSAFWLLILFWPALITTVSYAFITQLANVIGGASQMGGRIRSFI